MAVSSGTGPHQAWLVVNGQQWPVVSGTVEQSSERKSSQFSASIPMDEPGADAFFNSVEGGNQTQVVVLTRGQRKTLLTGEIDAISSDLMSRLFSISGRDKSCQLHQKKSSDKWVNKKGHEIVSDLAQRSNIETQVDQSTLKAGKIVNTDHVKLSDNVSHAYVIHKCAEFDGARWWVDANGILHYQSMDNPEGTYTIRYQAPTPDAPMVSDAIRLAIRRNLQAGKTVKVTVKSWHPKDKTTHTNTHTIEGKGGENHYNLHVPNLKQDHVKQHSTSRAKEAARHELSVSASLVGDPSIDVAMDLLLIGTVWFDQTYKIDHITHSFGMSGHSMEITARNCTEGRSESDSTADLLGP